MSGGITPRSGNTSFINQSLILKIQKSNRLVVTLIIKEELIMTVKKMQKNFKLREETISLIDEIKTITPELKLTTDYILLNSLRIYKERMRGEEFNQRRQAYFAFMEGLENE